MSRPYLSVRVTRERRYQSDVCVVKGFFLNFLKLLKFPIARIHSVDRLSAVPCVQSRAFVRHVRHVRPVRYSARLPPAARLSAACPPKPSAKADAVCAVMGFVSDVSDRSDRSVRHAQPPALRLCRKSGIFIAELKKISKKT